MVELTCAALARIDDLPTLPRVVVEVNRLMQDPDVSLQQVGDVIEKDPALASRILKLVNSSFFGFPARISSISRAVVLLGLGTVRSALFSVAVIPTVGPERGDETFDIRAFWKHSLAVAVIGRCIGERTGMADKADVFTAGLLHDIGKVILWQHFNERFRAIHDRGVAQGVPFHQAEDPHDTFSHAVIGAHLALRWQLPEPLRRAIGGHHNPGRGREADIECAVHLADMVSHVMEENSSVYRVEEASLAAQDPRWGMLRNAPRWYPALANEIEAACHFFIKD